MLLTAQQRMGVVQQPGVKASGLTFTRKIGEDQKVMSLLPAVSVMDHVQRLRSRNLRQYSAQARLGDVPVLTQLVGPQCWAGTATALGSDLILALGHAEAGSGRSALRLPLPHCFAMLLLA